VNRSQDILQSFFFDMAALTDITKLNKHMETASYIEGATPTQADISVFKAVAEPGSGFPHAQRWYKHIASFSATKVASLPGTFQTLSAGAAAPAPPPAKQEKQEKAPKEPKAPKEKKEKPAKEEKKKEEKAAAPDDAAKAAAADKKLREKIIKEGGKKGVEIEGASDMGGLDFFCTTMELPDGNEEHLELSMLAMNAEPDPEAEDRKGCSGHIGKMIYSAGVAQLALVAYVPDDEFNKSASKVDVGAWMDHVLGAIGGVVTKKATPVISQIPDKKTGDVLAGTNGKIKGKIVVAVAKADADKGKFPLKDKDAAMAAAFQFLRSKGAFPEDDGDESDDMVFGDDDDLDAFE